jgi:hypothetical protein
LEGDSFGVNNITDSILDLSSQRVVDVLLGLDDILVECDQIDVGNLVRSTNGSERALNLVRAELSL